MTRGGREKDRDDPERKCIATGESQPKAGLIRFCLGPDGQIVPDVMGKLPGRGIYVSAYRDALDKAAKKNLFSRAARQPVKVWLVKGTAKTLIQASDGSERGKTKLHAPDGAKGFIGCLSAGEIGLAFGRERAIHAALAAGGLRSRVVEEAAKLAGLRGQTGGDDGGETAMKDTKNA